MWVNIIILVKLVGFSSCFQLFLHIYNKVKVSKLFVRQLWFVFTAARDANWEGDKVKYHSLKHNT